MTTPRIEETNTRQFKELAKEYARQSYFVSEENHPEEDKVTALDNLVEYHHHQLQKAREEAYKKGKIDGVEEMLHGEVFKNGFLGKLADYSANNKTCQLCKHGCMFVGDKCHCRCHSELDQDNK